MSKPNLYQTARLFDPLPKTMNELWRPDVTYSHFPGHGGWYAVTVILAYHFTPSYCARDVNAALTLMCAEAERLHGPPGILPFLVTDKGAGFMSSAFHSHIDGLYAEVRVRYCTLSQPGLLERFQQMLKTEKVCSKRYAGLGEARTSPVSFSRRYNEVHSYRTLVPALDEYPLTPADVWVRAQAVALPKWQGWAKAAKKTFEGTIEDLHFPHPQLKVAP